MSCVRRMLDPGVLPSVLMCVCEQSHVRVAPNTQLKEGANPEDKIKQIHDLIVKFIKNKHNVR